MAQACMQASPAVSCGTGMIWGLQLFYSIGSSQGLQVVHWSPQATVLILVVIGSSGCIAICLAVPRMQRLRYWRGPTKMPLKRMNLLGLVRAAALACLLTSFCCMSSNQALWNPRWKNTETAMTAVIAHAIPCSSSHSHLTEKSPSPLPHSSPHSSVHKSSSRF